MKTVRYAAWVKLIDEVGYEIVNEPAAHLTLETAFFAWILFGVVQ